MREMTIIIQNIIKLNWNYIAGEKSLAKKL